MDNRQRLSRLLLRRLKERTRELNDQLGSRVLITGTKGLLIDRLLTYIISLEESGSHEQLQKTWSILEREEEGHQSWSSMSAAVNAHTANSLSTTSNTSCSPIHYELLNRLGDDAHSSPSLLSSQGYRHTVDLSRYADSNYMMFKQLDLTNSLITPMNTNSSSSANNGTSHLSLSFRSCPFYTDPQPLSDIVYAEVSNVKMTSVARFSLNSKNIETLTGSSYVPSRKTPKFSSHRVMVYCVDADQWRTMPHEPLSLEFPPVVELSINHTVIRKNLRGIKNRPGTVHPVDITPHCCLKPGAVNQLDISYINTPKKYVFVVCLSKVTQTSELVDKLKGRKPLEKSNVQQLLNRIASDTEITTTLSNVSLKCPLTHMRIQLPCRSRKCQHIQCFDATSFLELNAQTPTWQCPICNRLLQSWEELVWDTYFKEILDSTATSVDSIVMDDQGEWSIRPNSTGARTSPKTPSTRQDTVGGEKRKRLLFDIEDNSLPSSPTSPRSPSSSIAGNSNGDTSNTSNTAQIIDLTLSSSEDELEDESEKEIPVLNKKSKATNESISIKTESQLDSTATTHENGHDNNNNTDENETGNHSRPSDWIRRYLGGYVSTPSSSSTAPTSLPTTVSVTAEVVEPTTSAPAPVGTTTTSELLRKLNNLNERIQHARIPVSSVSTVDDVATNGITNNTGTTTPSISPTSDTGQTQWYSPNASPSSNANTNATTTNTAEMIPLNTTIRPTSHGTITTTLLSSTLPVNRNVLDDRVTPPTNSSNGHHRNTPTQWYTPSSDLAQRQPQRRLYNNTDNDGGAVYRDRLEPSHLSLYSTHPRHLSYDEWYRCTLPTPSSPIDSQLISQGSDMLAYYSSYNNIAASNSHNTDSYPHQYQRPPLPPHQQQQSQSQRYQQQQYQQQQQPYHSQYQQHHRQ